MLILVFLGATLDLTCCARSERTFLIRRSTRTDCKSSASTRTKRFQAGCRFTTGKLASVVRYVAMCVVVECDCVSRTVPSSLGGSGGEATASAGVPTKAFKSREATIDSSAFVPFDSDVIVVTGCALEVSVLSAVRFLCPLGERVLEIVCSNLLRLPPPPVVGGGVVAAAGLNALVPNACGVVGLGATIVGALPSCCSITGVDGAEIVAAA